MCITFPLDTNQFYWYQFESKRNDRRTNGRPNGMTDGQPQYKIWNWLYKSIKYLVVLANGPLYRLVVLCLLKIMTFII